MAAGPVSEAVSDALQGLVEAETASLLQRLREPLPVLARCSDHLRGILAALENDRAQRERALRGTLRRWNLPPRASPGPDPDPFFALLSMRFLLLKVAEAQALLRTRYDNAALALPPLDVDHVPEAAALIEAHRKQIRDGYDRLERELKAMGLEPAPEL